MARKTVKLHTRRDHPLEQLYFYAGLPQEKTASGQPINWLRFLVNDTWVNAQKQDSYNRMMIIKNCNVMPMVTKELQHPYLRCFHAAIVLLRNNDPRRAYFISETHLLEELLEKFAPSKLLGEINPELEAWMEEICVETINGDEVPLSNETGPYDRLAIKSFPGWPDVFEQKEFKKRLRTTLGQAKEQVKGSVKANPSITYRLVVPGIKLEAWHYCLMENIPLGELCLVQEDRIAPGMTRRNKT